MFQPINTVDSLYEKSIYKSFLDNINDKNFEECLKLHLKVKFDNNFFIGLVKKFAKIKQNT